jgi:hypothetical protein
MSEEIKKVEELVVDDGSITVPIKNTLGEKIGEFKFRPTDFNMVKRYNEISSKFADVVKPLIDANITPEGEGADEESVKILNEVENNLFELVDYLFDANMAEAFFGKMHPFSPVDGKFYCENVLNVVGDFIARKFDSEINKISARVDKYTHGYKTGKHKNGK